jgi:Cu2+-exporting ATPase
MRLARRSMAVIRQNIRWAYAYNALAIPAAALGWVPPWLAAIGMSASSIVVVWNSMRLLRERTEPLATATDAAAVRKANPALGPL